MADDSTIRPDAQRGLTGAHAEYLAGQAVDVELAQALGVRSLTSPADTAGLGDVWVNWANFPAILFPWTNEEGEVEYQVRPDDPTKDSRGRDRKYVFRKGMTPILWTVRPVPDATKMIIVEGTKQCLAAASYAPEGWAVYGIAGVRSWQKDNVPISDLIAADGREVVVILDADAADNPQVYEAGVELAQALATEGAIRTTFARLLGGKDKAGLDDVLAGRRENNRAAFLARIVKDAKLKPADKAPKPKRKSTEMPTSTDRSTLIVNRDRWLVINDLTAALLARWNAVELFCHGGVISRRKGDGMHPVDGGSFHDLVQETAITVNENEGANGTTYGYAWPDSGTMSATMSRADQFARLDRISHAPFVREDGTVVTEPGYDESTRTMLIPDPVFQGLTVPENPSAEDITVARELILNEWLGDFPFDSDIDRANVLALIITPAIRGMVPKVPLAVIDGLQMAVGKNLLADSLLTVYTGTAAEPMNWVPEPDELRKQITAAFRTGAEFFVFDEAHTIEGTALAQALTAETWQDRILGVSTMANFPNKVTWMSLGNQVQVKGDLTRRVYRIFLNPRGANPQDRRSESFRHPGQSGLDLGSWTRANRRELMTAILTLVRAWFAQGQPRPKRGVSFGSFEVWERIVGGIVETAGLTGFLANLKVWRSESDFDTQYWHGHLKWLREQFGAESFRTAKVKEKAMADMLAFLAPPNLDDPAEKGYTKSLGEAYSRLRGRQYDGLWIERDGSAHGHVSVWRVVDASDTTPPPEPAPPVRPEPDPQPVDEPVDEPVDDPKPDTEVSTSEREPTAGVITFDLETGDAGDLYKRQGGYVRMGATARDDDPVVSYAHDRTAEYVTRRMSGAATITGHNIMAFDLPALVREGALTMPEVHTMAAEGKIFDTILAARFLDPPMAKDKGVDATRKYDLGALGEKYGLGEKLTDVSKDLAKRYGGWDGIPIDDSEDGQAFKRYMVQDVELSRRLYDRFMIEFSGDIPSYLVREHRVAALATQISINGFLVDQTLLTERVIEVDERKAEALGWLSEHAGVPLADAKGKAYKSPLASRGGKDALIKALTEAGATSLWRTERSGDLDTSGEHMRHLAQEYHHLPAVRDIAKAVYRVVGARSVYQTIQDHTGPDGRVHPKIGFQQATGRWSVTSPGLTVLGKRGGRHVERAVLLPDPGEVLISADLSQVDMRALAWLSKDVAYTEMLKKEDPHAEIAFALFGDRAMREIAKPVGHGWNYGRGIKAISEANDIDPALVRQFDTSMRERFPRLVEWQDEVRAIAESGMLLDNGYGRLMRADPQRAHTQAPALMGQGAARDIMMAGMLRLPADILPMLRAQIHDEIVLSIPIDRVKEVSEAVVDALSFDLDGVPIMADVSPAGTDWSKCYEKS